MPRQPNRAPRAARTPWQAPLWVTLLVVSLLAAAGCGSDSADSGVGAVDALGDGSPSLPDAGGGGGDTAVKPDGSAPDATTPPDTTPDPDIVTPPDTTPDPDVVTPPDGGGDGCDDGDPCTSGDHLEGGICVGTAYTCDDGKDCTDDVCDGAGGCDYAIAADACLVDGVCVAEGDGGPCRTCDPAVSQTAWQLLEGGCDDGDACTDGDVCTDGVCLGAAVDCDDGNLCTDDACDAAEGCVYTDNAMACDDGDACTDGDVCLDGACVGGTPIDCDDGNDCTDDACDAGGGCVHTPQTGACDDGDACTDGDICEDGVCVGGAATDCDDGNSCTLDTCDPLTGCDHVLDADNPCCESGVNPCDDENPCTDDICNVDDGSCQNVAREGDCSDGDACTTGDVCVDGACVADGTLACDDANPCTADTCDPTDGCVYTPLGDGDGCDDGDACTTGDICTGGVCAGERLGCVDCPPAFWNPVDAITALAIGGNGQPGNGVDVDGDPTTCAPATDCSGGVDNQFSAALGALSSFVDVNAQLQAAIDQGQVSLLFEHRAPTFDGVAYTMAAYVGDAVVNGCDPEAQSCEYEIPAESLTATCDALLLFPNAAIADDAGALRLTAGGPASTFSLALPLLPGVVLDLTLYNARIEADATVAGGEVTALTNGLLGGAVRQQEVIDIVEALPDELFADVPGGKGMVLMLLPSLLVTDIDTDGDGAADATSIGLAFEAWGATVTGVTP